MADRWRTTKRYFAMRAPPVTVDWKTRSRNSSPRPADPAACSLCRSSHFPTARSDRHARRPSPHMVGDMIGSEVATAQPVLLTSTPASTMRWRWPTCWPAPTPNWSASRRPRATSRSTRSASTTSGCCSCAASGPSRCPGARASRWSRRCAPQRILTARGVGLRRTARTESRIETGGVLTEYDAAEAWIQAAREYPGELIGLVTGPLTNFALALRREPALPGSCGGS